MKHPTSLIILCAALCACQAPRYSAIQPTETSSTLYLDREQLPQVQTFKTLALLPWHVTFNTQDPGTERAVQRARLAKEQQYPLMRYEYGRFQSNVADLQVSIQHPDTTEALLRRAGISIDSLHFISRQRLLQVLGTDALLVHDLDINIYGVSVWAIAADAILTGFAFADPITAYTGIPYYAPIPGAFPTYKDQQSVVFSQLYGRGIEAPVWSYYGLSPYDGREVPPPPKKGSLKEYRAMQFPLLKPKRPGSHTP